MSDTRTFRLGVIFPQGGFDIEFDLSVNARLNDFKKAALSEINRILKNQGSKKNLSLNQLAFEDKNSKPLSNDVKLNSLPFFLPEEQFFARHSVDRPYTVLSYPIVRDLKVRVKEELKPQVKKQKVNTNAKPKIPGQINSLATISATQPPGFLSDDILRALSDTKKDLTTLINAQASLEVTAQNQVMFKMAVIALISRTTDNKILEFFYTTLKPSDNPSEDKLPMLHKRQFFTPGSIFYKFRSHETTKHWANIMAALEAKMLTNVIHGQYSEYNEGQLDVASVHKNLSDLSKNLTIDHSASHHHFDFFKPQATMRTKIDKLLEGKTEDSEAKKKITSIFYDYRLKGMNVGLNYSMPSFKII